MNDYQIVSPSLDGILHHESIVYEGIKRPFEVLRVLDGPSAKGKKKSDLSKRIAYTEQEYRVIERYIQDLHGLFMKKFSQLMIEPELRSDEALKIQAMLQEMIKIKGLISYRPKR